jgi:hypothetical protein
VVEELGDDLLVPQQQHPAGVGGRGVSHRSRGITIDDSQGNIQTQYGEIRIRIRTHLSVANASEATSKLRRWT